LPGYAGWKPLVPRHEFLTVADFARTFCCGAAIERIKKYQLL
jgi:hypothetical protein